MLRLGLLGACLSACAQPPGAVDQAIDHDAASAREPAVAAPEPTPPFEWPVPLGWRTETIPFPLGFAPGLRYDGLEEVRFAPGMFKPDREDFWTYAFVWWLSGSVAFAARTLEADLADYFEGLSLAVEHQDGFDPQQATATAVIEPVPQTKPGEALFEGTVLTHDPFATHARITLNVQIRVFRCEIEDRTVGLFLLSPQPSEHPLWGELAALRDAFRCCGRCFDRSSPTSAWLAPTGTPRRTAQRRGGREPGEAPSDQDRKLRARCLGSTSRATRI